jgi:hypothetical protein
LKTLKALVPGIPLLAFLSCQSGGGGLEPVVIDLSAARTHAPTATPTATPTRAVPVATTMPVVTVTPAPAAAPAVPADSPTLPPAAGTALLTPPPAPHPAGASRTPEVVAQSRIEAYNRRDLDALAALYAADAQVFDPPDRLRDSGLDQIRQTYARRLSSLERTSLSAAGRMSEGNFVVERETESGVDGSSRSAIVISEVRGGKIFRVWILR